MSLSVLDARAALVVVDLQQGTVHGPSGMPTGPVVERAAQLAGAFRRHDLPVVVVTMEGGPPGRVGVLQGRAVPPPDLGDVVPELRTAPGDLRVVKSRWGAFGGTTLHDQLSARGVTQVVVVGMATSIGVESTARQAYDLGFHVVVAADAVADRVTASHEHSLQHVFPLLGEVATTAEILTALDAR